ncbi:hypothetical protein Y886_27545 [Xanthomonas hyacinthi DSM 19077]|nr:hypothetical protein Y886_27545 [Xanthomonas hyacinthi DSM 19077]
MMFAFGPVQTLSGQAAPVRFELGELQTHSAKPRDASRHHAELFVRSLDDKTMRLQAMRNGNTKPAR